MTSTLPAVALVPGSYMLALLSGTTDSGAILYYAAVSDTKAGQYNANAYPTASPSWGTTQYENHLNSFYIDYTTTTTGPPPANTSLPLISGSAQQGQLLSGSDGGWSNSPTSFGYQWQRCDSNGAACLAIPTATSNSYTPGIADLGSTLRFQVTATNSSGPTSATSTQTAVVAAAPAPPVSTSLPAISGSAQQGQLLSGSDGGWSNSPTSFGYQWLRCDTGGAACVTIPAATGNSYTPGVADLGSTLRFQVTATNSAGPASATSAQTAVVTGPPPVSTSLPVISGTAQQGELLSGSDGGWANSPTSFGYQWLRCDTVGAACVAIPAATGNSYTPGVADLGSTLRFQVTATNSAGPASATSTQTAVVAAAPAPPVSTSVPVISGTAQQGQLLSGSDGDWANGPTSFGYQWLRCDTVGAACVAIPAATGNSYTPGVADLGSTLRFQVTATNSAGPASATSDQTAMVTAPSGT